MFDAAMAGGGPGQAAALLEVVDVAGVKTVVDVGGGKGGTLAALLGAVPTLRGVLADRPEVVAAAAPVLEAAGVADRCDVVPSDFFVEVPAGGDAYVLAQILHDWDDERAIDILTLCRRAIPAHGKLLVVELVLPEGEEPFFGKWLDLHILVNLGARERTAAQYDALFRRAGFQVAGVIPMPPGSSVVEAVPV
jgi:hypothetical protein